MPRGFEVGIARADVNDQTFFTGFLQLRELLDDAVHSPQFQGSRFKFQVLKMAAKNASAASTAIIISIFLNLFSGIKLWA